MAAVIYSLCAITGALCAWLMVRASADALQASAVELDLLCGSCTEQRRTLGGQAGVSHDGSFSPQDIDRPAGNAGPAVWVDLGGALITHLADVLSGAASMASLAVALFFLKFWRRTRDTFFLIFAAAFAIDAISRFALGVSQVSDTTEPMYFLPRLVMFGLIVAAIIGKNAERSGP